MRLSRAELRQRHRELRDLVNEWDPIGVMDDPTWPRDEYECLVGPLLRRLEAGATADEVAAYLHAELTGHFGLSTPLTQCREWAAAATAWYRARWPATESVPHADR